MGRFVAVLMLLSAWGCASAGLVEVRGARIADEGDKIRLLIDLSGAFSHNVFALPDPHRLVIDIPDAVLGCKLPVAPGNHAVLGGLRSGVREGDDLRMVIDLKQPVRPKSFQVKPTEESGYRLIVELVPSGAAAGQAAGTAGVRAAGKTDAKQAAVRPKAAKPREVVIAIDAGHGGKDAGAVGSKRTQEKDITLAVARRLAKLVAKEPGMRPYLVRDADTFIPLRQRMARARQQKADLFVSIHADAFHDPSVRGSSVYTLSPRGASSEAAKWLADRENAADLVGGVKLDEADGQLASVLLDMSQNATLEHSAVAAQMVLDKLGGLGSLHKEGVQRAGFVVLKSPDVPSMLVETAFISNPDEEARLRNPGHQQRLAEAILRGIKAYFQKYPNQSAALAGDGDGAATDPRHASSRAESLAGIAAR
jgi:N-acetylmuramoyl-L-alanine amidase